MRKSGKDQIARGMLAVLLLGLVTVLAGTGRAQSPATIPLPKSYGYYLLSGGKLLKLDSTTKEVATPRIEVRFGTSWDTLSTGIPPSTGLAEIPQFSQDLKLLVFEQRCALPLCGPMADVDSLWLVPYAYVRSFTGPDGRRAVLDAWAQSWATMHFSTKSVEGQPEMAVGVPNLGWIPGIYELVEADPVSRARQHVLLRFAVGNADEAQRAWCVDLVYNEGALPRLRPSRCADGDSGSAPPSSQDQRGPRARSELSSW
jgi:hypothetical protein